NGFHRHRSRNWVRSTAVIPSSVRCVPAQCFYKQGEHDTVQTLVLGSSLAPAAHHGKPGHNLYLRQDRKSTRLNSSHVSSSYVVISVVHSVPTRRSSDLNGFHRHRSRNWVRSTAVIPSSVRCVPAQCFYKQGEHDTVQTLVLGSSLAPAAHHGKPGHNLYLR